MASDPAEPWQEHQRKAQDPDQARARGYGLKTAKSRLTLANVLATEEAMHVRAEEDATAA